MRELLFSFSMEIPMTKKSFMTYEQQLDYLENDKDLLIPDREYAKTMLQRISYYSLIGGYKAPFKHRPSGKYLRGVTFDEIVSFYQFDEQLRYLFLKYILHVERELKSAISYYFCEKYGADQKEYLDKSHFVSDLKHKGEIARLIKTMNSVVSLPSSYPYIIHHIRQYNNVPLWVSINAMTFGTVSKFYQYMTNDLQIKIRNQYPVTSEKQLHLFITALAKCRNVCAHGERLYCFRTSDKSKIPDTILHKKLNISKKKGQYVQGKNDVFAIVLALRHLLPIDEFTSFTVALRHLISGVVETCPHVSEGQILAEMGFPSNWEAITSYKLIRSLL